MFNRNLSRYRDFHGESKVLGTSQNYSTNTDTNLNNSKFNTSLNNSQLHTMTNTKFDSVKTVSVDLESDFVLKPVKKITPMHLKLFESTMQNVSYILFKNIRTHILKKWLFRSLTFPSIKKIILTKPTVHLRLERN